MNRRKLGWAAALAFLTALLGYFVVMQHTGTCLSSGACTENFPMAVAVAFAYMGIAGVLIGSVLLILIVYSFPRTSGQHRRGTRLLVGLASLILVAPMPLLSSSWIFGKGPIHWTHPSPDGGIQCDGPSAPLRPTDPPGTMVTTRCVNAAQLVWTGLALVAGSLGLAYALRPRKALALVASGAAVASVISVIAWNTWGNTPRAQTEWRTLALFVAAFAAVVVASIRAEARLEKTQA